MPLTPARRARLDRLATYLERLPANYSHFYMGLYFTGGRGPDVVRYARENGGVGSCGTSACAVGHGPAAGILVPPRFLGQTFVDWALYEEAMFTGRDHRLHSWLFSGGWDGVDDTHLGAAARIRLLLSRGKPPSDFHYPDPRWLDAYAPFLASVDTRPKDGDAKQAPLASGAVGEAETPNP